MDTNVSKQQVGRGMNFLVKNFGESDGTRVIELKAGTSLDDSLTGVVKYKAGTVIDFWISTPTNHLTGDHNKWDKLPAIEQLSKEERLLVDIINCFMGRIKE